VLKRAKSARRNRGADRSDFDRSTSENGSESSMIDNRSTTICHLGPRMIRSPLQLGLRRDRFRRGSSTGCEARVGELVVARGDTPEMLHLVEEPIDEVSRPAEEWTEADRRFAVGARRNVGERVLYRGSAKLNRRLASTMLLAFKPASKSSTSVFSWTWPGVRPMHPYGGKQGADHHWGGDRAQADACMVLRNSRGTPTPL